MRRRLLTVGLILILIGVAFTVAGSYGIIKDTTLSTQVTQYSSGMYITEKMTMNKSSTLLVMGVTVDSALINASDLSAVNQSNLHSHEVQYTTKEGNNYLYQNIKGEFYFVMLSSSAPKIQYAYAAGSLDQFLLSSMLTVMGPIVLVAGIVVSVVGAFLKPKRDPLDDLLK